MKNIGIFLRVKVLSDTLLDGRQIVEILRNHSNKMLRVYRENPKYFHSLCLKVDCLNLKMYFSFHAQEHHLMLFF